MGKKVSHKTIEDIIGTYLKRLHLTVSVAESCTGGMLSNKITNIPGSSSYFIMAIIAYSNKSKEKLLGLPEKIIKRYGAVSKETAKLMAENVRKKAKADIGLSVTGIAGPRGATYIKPVGLVFIGLAIKGEKTIVKKHYFKGKRIQIKGKVATTTLKLLKEFLENVTR